jgi:hypothetical protein
LYRHDLTATYVRELLHYNPDTGDLRWRATKSGRRSSSAGSTGEWGNGGKRRRTVVIDYHVYKAHRLIWLWMTGEWPTGQIDHINRDALDNRWVNLRDTTAVGNARNRSMNRNNTSGENGIHWDKTQKRWRLYLQGKYVASSLTKTKIVRLSKAIQALLIVAPYAF